MLFKTLDEFQPFIPANQGFTFENLETFIFKAEQKQIRPILGKVLFDKLQTDYDAGSSDVKHLALLERVRYALASLAFHKYMPWAVVQLSDSGIRVPVGDNYRPATEKQILRLMDSTLEDGYDNLEWLVSFLMENTADYALWDFENSNQYFLNSADDFNAHCHIGESRLIYLKMLPQMKRVERIVSNHISKQQFAVFKAIIADKDTDFSEEQEPVVYLLKTAVANLTFSHSIQTLPVAISGKEISIFNNQFMTDYAPGIAPDANLSKHMQQKHETAGYEALKLATDLMEADLASFPQYEDNCYVAPEEAVDLDEHSESFFMG
jgi:hypothetical protein